MRFEVVKHRSGIMDDWNIVIDDKQVVYHLISGNKAVGIVVIEEETNIKIKHIEVRESYQGQGLSRWMIYNLLILYPTKNLMAIGHEMFFGKLGFEFNGYRGVLINTQNRSGKIGDWESFEIMNYSDDYMLQMFYKGIANDDVYLMRNYHVLTALKGKINTPSIIGIMEIDDRIGFILEKKNDILMAIEIRQNPDAHKRIAKEMALLHREIHESDLDLELRHTVDYLRNALEKLKMVPDYKKQILATFDSLPIEHTFCHNDYGPYHVLKSKDSYYVFDWSSASYGDYHGDVARSIFWLCSNYVPGIGAYLLSKEIKIEFVNNYLAAYGDVDMTRIIKYLVIFAAIEYDTELQDEGLTPDIELLHQMIVDYYDGKEINIFDYLIYEGDQ